MKTLLPGLDSQLSFLRKNYSGTPSSILVMGSSSEGIAIRLEEMYKCKVDLIVEDYESLMNAKLIINDNQNIFVSLMSFESTDFVAGQFDLIYAQASISLSNRNKIVKEIKRILSLEGSLCIGEIVSLTKEPPKFVLDIFESSNLLPLHYDNLEKYYKERGLIIEARVDLSSTLFDYYHVSAKHLSTAKDQMDDKEQSYYKKLISKIKHESYSYIKLGGDKHIGFDAILLTKEKI